VASDIRRVRLVSPGGHEFSFDFGGKAMGHVLFRDRFDQWLADIAERRGVDVLLGASYPDDVEPATEYVVVAEGPSWRVAGRFGFDAVPPADDVLSCLQYVVEADHARGEISLYFSRRWAPRAYAWAFDYGEDLIEVGVGVPTSLGGPRKYLDRFLRDHPDLQGPVVRRDGGLVPTAKPIARPVRGNVLLVGDAARVTVPSTGAGIGTGMVSGRLAGMAIARREPGAYGRWVRARLHAYLRTQYAVKRVLTSWGDRELDGLVRAFTGHSLKSLRVDRELARGAMRFLARRPRWIPSFARELLKAFAL